MSSLKRLRAEIEEKQAERSKAQGALESIEKTWKEEHGLESKEDVEAHIEKLNTKIKNLKETYDEKVESVKEKLDGMG